MRDKVIKELKEREEGYTISELATKLGVSRQTVSNAFAYLEGAGNVSIRKVGMAKIYYWKNE
jgi:predicted transcriptional regulator